MSISNENCDPDDKSKLLANHQKGCSDVSKWFGSGRHGVLKGVPLFQPCRWGGEHDKIDVHT